MLDTQYVLGTPADRDDIIDFANYVFSQAHVPHDFKKLLPKVYADGVEGIEQWHFLAKQNGKIRGMIACKPLTMHVLDKTLHYGSVGTVSVHPYSRGEGHMKVLMSLMIADSRAKNYDMLFLGGQRQRYNYFGFEQAGMAFSCSVSATNVRHALKNVDASGVTFSELTEERPEEVDYACRLSQTQLLHGERPRGEFLAIMHSWKSSCKLICVDGRMAGYIMGDGRELVLEEENLLPRVLKALFEQEPARESLSLFVPPFCTERARFLARLCEGVSVKPVELINVLNWKNVLEAFFLLKAGYTTLEDGEACVRVDNQTVTIRVKDGVPAVTEGGENPTELEHLEAQRLFFGVEQTVLPDLRYKNWLPLPFYISTADTF